VVVPHGHVASCEVLGPRLLEGGRTRYSEDRARFAQRAEKPVERDRVPLAFAQEDRLTVGSSVADTVAKLKELESKRERGVLYVGIDLGTSRTSVAASRCARNSLGVAGGPASSAARVRPSSSRSSTSRLRSPPDSSPTSTKRPASFGWSS
jgi:hypothetical protein